MTGLPPLAPYDPTPWETPLPERVQQAYFAAQRGYKLALQVHRSPPVDFCMRYRCHNVAQALRGGKRWRNVWFLEDELDAVTELLPLASLVVMVRLRWTVPLSVTVKRAKRFGIPVAYDIDDLAADVDKTALLVNTLGDSLQSDDDYRNWTGKIVRYQQMAAEVDAFLVTSTALGDQMAEQFGKPFQVLPNFLNREQMRASEEMRAHKQRYRPGGPLKIGYFSGTDTHYNDFLVAANEIARFCERHPDASLTVVGPMRLPAAMDAGLARGQVKRLPLVDFVELQRLTASVDVSIAPLVDNLFTDCKSDLKYFEPAVAGTLVLASPAFAFRQSIRSGENGFLCRPGEWYGTLEKIYRGEVALDAILTAAREDAIARYAPENMLETVENAFEALAPAHREVCMPQPEQQLQKQPLVSILMLAHNAPEYVRLALDTLAATQDVACEVIVLDNASDEETQALLWQCKREGLIDKLLFESENTYFARGNNLASHFCDAASKYILLLNSDVEIKNPFWLRSMLDIHTPGATALGRFSTDAGRCVADGYCFLIDKPLYFEYQMREDFEWAYSLADLQARLLRAGHDVRAVLEHEELLHHFGGKSGTAYLSAKNWRVEDSPYDGWLSASEKQVKPIYSLTKAIGSGKDSYHKKRGICPDDWCLADAELEIVTGPEGIVRLKGYYPRELNGTEACVFRSGAEMLEAPIQEQLFEVEIPAAPNTLVSIGIAPNFSFCPDPPDIRELCFLLTEVEGR